ncbi:hypothetical protein N0V82_008566 [Gnomoniopsis sp. IMI 355080]|nr:hypothetical protein N0V82_008566 [Gnomoniopsis sp. IMI 355080]
MSTYAKELNAIIIGAGPAGIAMAYRLKHELDFHDFTIYEKLDGVGGTWRANSYPGCFNPNPNWSKELCEQPEILQYMEDTVDKFDIRKHVKSSVECTGAVWRNDIQKWEVNFRDLQTKVEFSHFASIFVSAVGAISFPRDVKFPGMENFKGHMFHTARWDHSVSYANKRVAVIGNGCSAAQVVPATAQKAAYVQQYARSGQWFHARPNRQYTEVEKFMFRYVPLYEKLLRLRIFLEADEETTTYFPTPKGLKIRTQMEAESKKYMQSKTPEKYWQHLIPKFPLGCKRRIFDPGYLDALNLPNVSLLPEGIQEITETGIVSTSGQRDDFDIIVLATGFQVSDFLVPMEITGADGRTLHQQWKECRGAQAYLGTHVHNFPNLAILFGPNTFPANNSALFACETQVDYAIKSLFTPLLDHRADVIEVKRTVEDYTTNAIHKQLSNTVFSGDCSNWYIGNYGRNAASWPGKAASFWASTYFPDWSAFNLIGGSSLWPLYALRRRVHTASFFTKALVVLGVLATASRSGTVRSRIPDVARIVRTWIGQAS